MYFGDGGPVMSGHWFNPKTNDTFTVRDCFFEDNNLIVTTTDGRRLDYNMVADYVKTDKPMDLPKKTQQSNIPVNILNEIEPTDVNNELLLADDLAVLNNPISQNTSLGNIAKINNANENLNLQPVISEDEMLINRILKRTQGPKVEFTVSWDCFPEKRIEMLEMLGIDPEAVAEYYIKENSMESIVKDVNKAIRKIIIAKLMPKDSKELIDAKPNEVIAEEIKLDVQKALSKKTKNKNKNKK